MSMVSEFKAFAMRGNVVDLAVGVIIGAAFGKIVTSVVEDVIMPPIGLLVGGIDFSKLAFTIQQAIGDKPAVAIRYGIFFNAVINFLIVAFCIFIIVKMMNTLQRKSEVPAPPPEPTKEEILLTEIRDLLKAK
jgi:large conductance mechanosensitive channel